MRAILFDWACQAAWIIAASVLATKILDQLPKLVFPFDLVLSFVVFFVIYSAAIALDEAFKRRARA
jgi:hypothetical protein